MTQNFKTLEILKEIFEEWTQKLVATISLFMSDSMGMSKKCQEGNDRHGTNFV